MIRTAGGSDDTFCDAIGESHRPMDRQPDRVLIRPDNSMFAMCGEKHVPAGTEESLASPILELNASRPLNHHHPLVTLLIVPEPFRRRVSVRCNPFDADVPVLDSVSRNSSCCLGGRSVRIFAVFMVCTILRQAGRVKQGRQDNVRTCYGFAPGVLVSSVTTRSP